MYIIFDNEGKETLRYFLQDLPEELKENEYIEIDEKDIPKKEGHITKAKLANNKLEWEFVKIPKSKEEVLLERIERQEKQLSVLSDTLDFLIMEGVDIND